MFLDCATKRRKGADIRYKKVLLPFVRLVGNERSVIYVIWGPASTADLHALTIATYTYELRADDHICTGLQVGHGLSR